MLEVVARPWSDQYMWVNFRVKICFRIDVCYWFSFPVLGLEPRASCMLVRQATPQPTQYLFGAQVLGSF